jgi:hypothetical protein
MRHRAAGSLPVVQGTLLGGCSQFVFIREIRAAIQMQGRQWIGKPWAKRQTS